MFSMNGKSAWQEGDGAKYESNLKRTETFYKD